jgi:ferredoxin
MNRPLPHTPTDRNPAADIDEALLRRCVHCGLCTSSCPTFAELGDENEGPRGVDPLDLPAGGAGDPGNTSGWLPYFNGSNDVSLTAWSSSDPIPSYAIAYAFGAFLARNYGGAAFLRAVVHNRESGTGAIDEALDSLGYRETYREILSRWAAAVILSDEEDAPADPPEGEVSYNAGTWFESSEGGETFLLGSINLYNYLSQQDGLLEGPKIYSGSVVGVDLSRPGSSVVYYKVGAGITGTHEWDISLGERTDLVVVARPAQ